MLPLEKNTISPYDDEKSDQMIIIITIINIIITTTIYTISPSDDEKSNQTNDQPSPPHWTALTAKASNSLNIRKSKFENWSEKVKVEPKR